MRCFSIFTRISNILPWALFIIVILSQYLDFRVSAESNSIVEIVTPPENAFGFYPKYSFTLTAFRRGLCAFIFGAMNSRG